MPAIRLQTLSGVPILNDREPASNYGQDGYRIRPYLDQAFAQRIERAFSFMFQGISAAGLGQVTAILTHMPDGGDSNSESSYKSQLRAFSLDGLLLSQGRKWNAFSFPEKKFEYLLIEAHLRLHFGTVLGYGYDFATQDHLYFDDGEEPGFHPYSKSRVLFLQNAARYLFDRMIKVDGIYGPETQLAERRLRTELQIGKLTDLDNWTALLSAIIEEAQDRLADPSLQALTTEFEPT